MPAQFFHRVDQPASGAFRQIDLAGIAGDDHFRIVAQTRKKHQHLCRRRVLCLVEDDHAVVERSPAHEGQRDHLDHVVDHEPLDLLEIHHVVQGVEQGPQIRVHLGLQIAGEKPQPFAGLDRRPGQDEPSGLAMLEQAGGRGDGQIGLAGAGRARCRTSGHARKSPRRIASGPSVLGRIGVPLGIDVNLVGGPLAFFIDGPADRLAHVLDAEPVLPAELLLHLLQHCGSLANLLALAGDANFIGTARNLHAERVADHAQIAIGRPEEGELLVRLFQCEV